MLYSSSLIGVCCLSRSVSYAYDAKNCKCNLLYKGQSFQQIVLRQLDIHMPERKRWRTLVCTSFNVKWKTIQIQMSFRANWLAMLFKSST